MKTSAKGRNVRRLGRSAWRVGIGLKSRVKSCVEQMTHRTDYREKTVCNIIYQKLKNADIFSNNFMCLYFVL